MSIVVVIVCAVLFQSLTCFTVFLVALCCKDSVEHHLVIIVNGIYHLLDDLTGAVRRKAEGSSARLSYLMEIRSHHLYLAVQALRSNEPCALLEPSF